MPTALNARLPADLSVSTTPNGGGDSVGAVDAASSKVVLSSSDSATYVEGQSVSATRQVGDTAGFSESATIDFVQVFQSDTATFTEDHLVGTPVDESEQWTATEDQSIHAVLPPDYDTASFAEAEDARETQRWVDGAGDTGASRETQGVIRYVSVFRPPTIDEGGHFGGHHRLFSRYRLAAGITVAFKGAVADELMYPAQEDLLAYDRIYRGGYAYPLTVDEIELLTAAGYGDHIALERQPWRDDDPGP